eukprot:scaffold10595_cov116-Cylindrotheca_fusiformis.AAC.1
MKTKGIGVVKPGEDKPKAPQRVQGVKRLRGDLWALQELMQDERPPKRRVRSKTTIEVFYGFGDASAEGFCATFQQVVNKGEMIERADRIFYRYGHWCTSVSEQSSNFRELMNLVESLEVQVRTGKLKDAEIFLFTDNSTAEGVYYKGNSTSQKLFRLVVRLRRLEMIGELTLHVIHVAGTRMIASGADGGSRGDLNQGSMAGILILTYVPLHLSAEERSVGVENWVRSWWGTDLGELETLTPEGWFDNSQRAEGPFLWLPPPAAADVVAEMLGEAKIKRPQGTHVVVVPRLMTGRWRRALLKETDFSFVVRPGTNLGACPELPFWKDWSANCEVCQKVVKNGGGIFCANYANERGSFKPCLKAWCGGCYSVPPGNEFPIRRPVDEDGLENLAPGDEHRFCRGRNGDFMMTPFQCDLCHFRNIQKRDPEEHPGDDKLLRFIRQANLDAFWSRESSTVAANLSQARRLEEMTDEFNVAAFIPEHGPFPLEDTFGMLMAVGVLRRSLDPGKTEETIQFATARKIRSAFSNAYHTTHRLSHLATMAYETTKTFSTTCPTYGYWFERFMLGCHKRMGDATVTDFALSKPIFAELLKHLEGDYQRSSMVEEKFKLAEFANLLIFLFLTGLRGEEGMKIDVAGFLKYLEIGYEHPTHPHVVLPLLGRLKGEQGERYHMIFMARVTKSGVRAGVWADRLGLLIYHHKGWRNGWIFRQPDGEQAKIGQYDEEFITRLIRVQGRRPDLFEPNLEVVDVYGLRRSPRRGSTSEATNAGVRREVIELNNRWRKFERAKGRNPSMDMASHYTEVRLMLKSFLEYSYSF